MAKSTSTANWQNVDIATMPADIRKAYDAYKAAYTAMKADREAFESAMRSALASAMPKGKRAVFGYNFGKLSLAVVDDEPAKPSAKGAISLADLIRK